MNFIECQNRHEKFKFVRKYHSKKIMEDVHIHEHVTMQLVCNLSCIKQSTHCKVINIFF